MPEPHLIPIPSIIDDRGSFSKIFTSQSLSFSEYFFSVSKKNVLRGLHFQSKTANTAKIVFLTSGSCIDVCVDIDIHSKNYGKVYSFMLKTLDFAVFIPRGFAHGFYCLEDNTTMHYMQEKCYNKECDTGILWNSIDFKWPNNSPIISKRDTTFQSLNEYKIFNNRG